MTPTWSVHPPKNKMYKYICFGRTYCRNFNKPIYDGGQINPIRVLMNYETKGFGNTISMVYVNLYINVYLA